MHEWIGVGPSASSQFNGRRYTNSHSLKEWRESIAEGRIEKSRIDVLELDDSILLADRIGFGIRKNEGIPTHEALIPNSPTQLQELEIWPWFQELEQAGLAEIDNARLRLTLDGRLVADAIAAEVMEKLG